MITFPIRALAPASSGSTLTGLDWLAICAYFSILLASWYLAPG